MQSIIKDSRAFIKPRKQLYLELMVSDVLLFLYIVALSALTIGNVDSLLSYCMSGDFWKTIESALSLCLLAYLNIHLHWMDQTYRIHENFSVRIRFLQHYKVVKDVVAMFITLAEDDPEAVVSYRHFIKPFIKSSKLDTWDNVWPNQGSLLSEMTASNALFAVYMGSLLKDVLVGRDSAKCKRISNSDKQYCIGWQTPHPELTPQSERYIARFFPELVLQFPTTFSEETLDSLKPGLGKLRESLLALNYGGRELEEAMRQWIASDTMSIVQVSLPTDVAH